MHQHRTPLRLAVVLGLLAITLLGFAAPVLAHVELASSDPADQSTLSTPPERIELAFTTEMEPAGEGVRLINNSGTEITSEVSQPTGDRLVVVPAEPLDAGSYGIAWTVRAGDAHPRSGSIAFSVRGPAVPTTPSNSDPIETLPEAAVVPQAASPATAQPEPAPSVRIDEPNTVPGEWIGRIGRWIGLLGALVGIGALAFAASALVGTAREVSEAAYWLRRSGVLVVAGTILEVMGAGMVLDGSLLGGALPGVLVSALGGAFGVAVLLRLAGGVAMVVGAEVASTPFASIEAESLEGIGAPPVAGYSATLTAEQASLDHRLDLRRSVVALGGVAAVAVSYLFDGHTVTASPTWLVRVADVAHVVGAGVWVGGVLMLGRILTWRWRRGVPLNAGELAVRFSGVASVALVVVATAGLALTWSILDNPGELVTTAWGRLLLVKLAAVGIAAALGGYNHRYVVPVLAKDRSNEQVAHILRRVVRIEGAVLIFVVAVTAVLVGAAS